MFEAAELGHRLSREEYHRIEPELRAELLEAQFRLGQQKRSALVLLISGVRGAGKGETVNLLNAWMDPRHILTHAFDNPSDEEVERPPMWRYWRKLPPKGQIGMLFGSWYTAPIIDRVFKRSKAATLLHAIDEINAFEKMLTEEGVQVLKFWFHLGKDQQRKRLKSLEADPNTRWRVTERDWAFFKHYDRFRQISEDVLRATSTGCAPWTVVEGENPEYRSIVVGRTLLAAMRKCLDQPEETAARTSAPSPILRPVDDLCILDRIDLTAAVAKPAYEKRIAKLQAELSLLTRDPRFASHNVVCVFEGMDAAGKGGAIRRLTAALDARLYETIPIAAPSDEERAQPYLWRFWRHLPRKGRYTIYDRSWYGRVLVERVEGFCPEAAWRRAYSEINQFEQQLTSQGTIVVKFWLQISQDEQLRRFEEREKTRFKQFKITAEDWRNREKWDDYEAAASDMIERTSTHNAPWTLVAANDKYHARIKVLETVVSAVKSRLAKD
jgi:AMP-polyphosphate phosphotransferase